MAFKSRKENGGQLDPNINAAGRLKSDKRKTKRSVMDAELMSLLRKVRPLYSESIMAIIETIRNKETSDVNKLRAAFKIVDLNRDLVKDIGLDDDSEAEGQETQPQESAPIFSLRMVNGDKQE